MRAEIMYSTIDNKYIVYIENDMGSYRGKIFSDYMIERAKRKAIEKGV